MPFYEYQCRACGEETEVLQKITDAPLRKCPACGKNQLQKLVSAPVFRLKGGGWYETDFKSDGETRRNLAGDEGGEKEKSSDGDKGKEGDGKSGSATKKSVARPARSGVTSRPSKVAARSAKPAARKAAPAKKSARPASRGKAARGRR